MKMSSFEYQMTKLDYLVLEAAVANTSLARQSLDRLKSISNKRPAPKVTSLEDDGPLLDNVPI